MQKHVLQVNEPDGGSHQGGAYRSQKFPEQLNFDELVDRKEVLH